MYAIVYKNNPTVVEAVSQQDATACNLGIVAIFDLTNNSQLIEGKWSILETINCEQYACG